MVHISARFFVFVLADVVLFVLDYRQYFCKLLNRVLERESGEKMGGGEGGAARQSLAAGAATAEVDVVVCGCDGI